MSFFDLMLQMTQIDEKILNIKMSCVMQDRVRYQRAILMYKIMHNLTPPYLSITCIFKFSNEVHNRALRSTAEKLLYVPKPNTKIYRKSLAYSGSKIWNSIPEHIGNANSLQQFQMGSKCGPLFTLGIELSFCSKMYKFVLN